ncbi:MAG: C25 family cysteine peptidase [Aminipila sp.]
MKSILKLRSLMFMLVLIIISTQCSFALGQDQSNTKDEVGEPMRVNEDSGLDGVNATVLESDSDHTVIRFDVGEFAKNAVDIEESEYYKIICEGTSFEEELGSPELPRICRSITIPDSADTKVSVLSSEYTDYENCPIAPSKGSISRDVNPDDIPYTFGEAYKGEGWYPSGEMVSISDPFIMRELSGVTVRVNAFQYQPSTKTLRVYDSVTVEVKNGEQSNAFSLDSSTPTHTTEAFEAAYQNLFINYNSGQGLRTMAATPSENGDMLIIAYDKFSSAMDPFIQWKNSKGINTTMVKMSKVSSRNNPTEIKRYIKNYYNQHPSLAYVLLVGDYQYISSPKYTTGVSDPEYTKVAGNDNYPDIFVGRFSAESIADVQTQVQRTIDFEKNGSNTADWFKNGVGIASDEGSNESDAEHMDNIRNRLLNSGYTQIDRIYDPGASASQVTDSLNQGRGIINYCGHGAQTYWVSTKFSNSDVAALQNQGHLPFIVSVSCVSGKFQSGTCFAEAWLRSQNSNGNPVGAIGTYMSTINQDWIPPMVGQDAIIDQVCNKTKTSFGGLCYTGASKMLDNGTSSDIETFNTWTVFGDPSVQLIPN